MGHYNSCRERYCSVCGQVEGKCEHTKKKINNLSPSLKQKQDLLAEEEVLNKLSEAFSLFYKLEKQHPKDLNEFVNGIHQCQQIISLRFARYYRPDIFPIKYVNKKDCHE